LRKGTLVLFNITGEGDQHWTHVGEATRRAIKATIFFESIFAIIFQTCLVIGTNVDYKWALVASY